MSRHNYPCPKCGKSMYKGSKTPAGKQRWTCETQQAGERIRCYSTTNPKSKSVMGHKPGVALAGLPVYKYTPKPTTKTFIVTAAVNNTLAHPGFLESLKHCVKFHKAELIVQAMHYKNPTTKKEAEREAEETWWDERLVPFLTNQRLVLGKNVSFLGDIRISPTAVSPLTGLEGFTGAESTVVGHTKLQMKVVPTPGHKLPKIMTTTGAITRPVYSDSRAGAHGKFHHTLGAVIIQMDGPLFYLRHLNADSSGTFNDLEDRFTPEGHEPAPAVAAIALGDIHVDFIDPQVQDATFGPNGLVETLRPANLIYHDLNDDYACNPHHKFKPFNAVAKRKGGTDNVEAETRRAIKWAKNFTPPWSKGWIVRSNHNDFLLRYLENTDWRTDPTNAEFYLETALALARSAKMGAGGSEYADPFGYWVEKYKIPNVKMVGEDGLIIAGISLDNHGDKGPNGARGSIRGFRRIGMKSVIGHSHSPGIEEGAYQTGTSSLLKLEYNRDGLSSWLNSHVVVHANGKRQHVIFINGKYRP